MTSNPRASIGQLLRYGLVGATVNMGGYLLFLLLTWLGVEAKAAMTVLYVAGASAGFWSNRNWTFGHRGSITVPALKYFGVHVCGYLLQYAMLAVLVDRLHFSYRVVQAIATVVVAGLLFVTFKYLVFPRPEPAARSNL
ncbi:GtrA family protein [Paraburkholderia kirstenboschensis]|uniref:GtrA family protein n=1 Tax=Paraburkholderia kirstenboschensis TaxID=1245436 RepID=A0ABZ0EN84_9BURK|nr:GtrA family protein [Paraburkholderia kirstenboschensis]WOD18648.1 GtrA family protein [Paraburkholderia kirstenboschensis]